MRKMILALVAAATVGSMAIPAAADAQPPRTVTTTTTTTHTTKAHPRHWGRHRRVCRWVWRGRRRVRVCHWVRW